jgi:hypothetical protein
MALFTSSDGAVFTDRGPNAVGIHRDQDFRREMP